MAPGTRRGNRSGYPEHDDFEGLPVRQWRHEWINIAPPPPQDNAPLNDRWAHELPWGMPKDWHLLAPHSQDLLRAARSGRLYKRPAPTEEEETAENGEEKTTAVGEKQEKKEEPAAQNGVMVKTWRPVSRNVEGATVSHLAKRHKSTITLPSMAVAIQTAGAMVTRATVRKIDAAGNPYEQTITLAEGQRVDGEIIATSLVPAPAARGGDTALKQPAPIRRKPPPPRRKPKGPGRGRKKKLMPVAGEQLSHVPSNGEQQATAREGGLKPENDQEGSTNQDSEMADNSQAPSEDEEGEEGDEGDDDDQDDDTPDRENGPDQDKDQTMVDSPNVTEIEPKNEPEQQPSTTEASPDPSTLAPPQNAQGLEGSPLKQVLVQSPTENTYALSPGAANATIAEAEAPNPADTALSEGPLDVEMTSAPLNATTVGPELAPPTVKSVPEAEEIPSALPSLRGDNRPHHAVTETRIDEVAQEVPTPLPDAAEQRIHPGASSDTTDVGSVIPNLRGTDGPPAEERSQQTQELPVPSEPTPTAPVDEQTQLEISEESVPAPIASVESAAILKSATGPEDDDEGPNLLSSLEAELDRQAEPDGKGAEDAAVAPAASEPAATVEDVPSAAADVPVDGGLPGSDGSARDEEQQQPIDE